jgi:hypothetical protein
MGSQDGIEAGPEDCVYPAELGGTEELRRCERPLDKTCAQGLEPDLEGAALRPSA